MTIRQLKQLGLGRGRIEHRRATDRLRPVHVGVYSVGSAPLTVDAGLLAAVMACGSDAVLSHEHAAHLWGMFPPWIEIDPGPVHVTVPPGSRRGRRPGIAVHRTVVDPDERAIRREIPVTSAARTLADLGAHLGVRELDRAVDRSLSDELVTRNDLREAANRRRVGTALRTLLDAAERLDGLTNSELEEAFLRLVRQAGLPTPSLNAVIEGMRVDAVWREQQVAVELDGYRWHRTRSRQESDRTREVKLRQAGFTPVRYSARQVFDEPHVTLADLAGVLGERRA